MKKIAIMCALLAGTYASKAQTSDTTQLNEVTVKGRVKTIKERAEYKRHGQTTEVLTKEELNRNNPAFIDQSLNTMAGVQVDKRTQLGGQRIVIRGYGNDQKFNNWGIKAYYNGIPITTADGVTVLDDIDFAAINNIEVIKGPAATMYGGGVGGVARFYLKNTDKKGITLSQTLNGGSFSLLQSNTKVEIVNDKSSFSINYGYLNSDGYRPNGASTKKFLNVFGEFNLSARQKISIYASHNKSYEGVSGQIPYADYYAGIDVGNRAYIRKGAKNDFSVDRVGISNHYAFTNNFTNTTSLFYSNSDYTSISAGAHGNSMNPNYGLRSVFTLKNKLFKDFYNELNAGIELQQSKSIATSFRYTNAVDSIPLQVQDISKGSYFRNTNNQSNYFIHDRITYKPYDMSLIIGLSNSGLKYDRIDLLAGPGLLSAASYGKNLSFSNSFKSTFNPHIALQKTYKNQIFNISYSKGFNAPTSATTFISGINKTNDSLAAETASMVDISAQGLLFDTKFDYQVSWFSMKINNKLTQLAAKDPVSLVNYTYWANTGNQQNTGIEASLGYIFTPKKNSFITKLEPFVSLSNYNFTYSNFKTKFGSAVVDYTGKKVVGVPTMKYTIGFDIKTKMGFYMNNTFNSIGDVYTDFANTNLVKGYTSLNSKIGFKKSFLSNNLDVDAYFAGNNLTNQINYTFLFLGNNVNDSDPGSGFPSNVATDINPGYSKAWYYGGVSLMYHLK